MKSTRPKAKDDDILTASQSLHYSTSSSSSSIGSIPSAPPYFPSHYGSGYLSDPLPYKLTKDEEKEPAIENAFYRPHYAEHDPLLENINPGTPNEFENIPTLTFWQRLKFRIILFFSPSFLEDNSYGIRKIAVDPEVEAKKATVVGILDGYISWWKLSWFGHHHNERAKVLKNEINGCHTTNEIREALNSQKGSLEIASIDKSLGIVKHKYKQELDEGSRWDSSFAVKNPLKHISKNEGAYKIEDRFFKPSGFLNKINECLNIFEMKSETPGNSVSKKMQ